MAKSNKTKTLKKKSKGKRKMHDTKKRVKHDKNYIHIDNTGLTKLMYTEGNSSPKKTIFKWDGKYDGKNANIQMDLNVDGKKTHSDLKLSNKDLMQILSANVVNKPIDRRLELLDEPISNMYSSHSPLPLPSSSMMILAQEPQMMSPPSNVPVFINEMPMEDQEQMMILSSLSPSLSPSKKGKKRSKSQRS
jgi:hypothetical protein